MTVRIPDVISGNNKVQRKQSPPLSKCLFLGVWEAFPEAVSRLPFTYHRWEISSMLLANRSWTRSPWIIMTDWLRLDLMVAWSRIVAKR